MDLQEDAYLGGKARAAWPWAIVREERDGTWWLYRTPGSVGEMLTPNVNTPAHPRAAFHAARARLYELRRAAGLEKRGARG